MLYNWTEALLDKPESGQGTLSGGQACYRVYTARDGKAVALGALEPKFWANFCNAVERPDLIDNYLERDRQTYLINEVGGIFYTKTADEWQTVLGEADCCFTVANMPDEIGNDPHYQARGMLGRFDDGTPWMRSPVRISESSPEISNEIPKYGGDTRAILLEHGYSSDDIDELLKARAVSL